MRRSQNEYKAKSRILISDTDSCNDYSWFIVLWESNLCSPLHEEATNSSKTVETQQSLVEEYPPSGEELEEYELKYAEAETFLPLGVQANESLVSLESIAKKAKVSILSISRVTDQEPIEQASEEFANDTYTTELRTKYPADFRKMIDLLMEEERIWNMSSFSYTKSGEKEYLANLDFELHYRIKNNDYFIIYGK